MLDIHLEIIQRRWPKLAEWLQNYQCAPALLQDTTPCKTLIFDDIHIGSGYDPDKEAKAQALLIPQGSSSAWVYGIGTGHLINTLRSRVTLREIKVAILNPRIALTLLDCCDDHQSWLNDPRVTLLDSSDNNFGTPLAAVPACLQLADEQASRLRDLVSTELETSYIKSKHGAESSEVKNRIKTNEVLIESDGDVSSLFNSTPGGRIVVAAAGPSLGKHIDWLKAHRSEYSLIAVNSALKPLSLANLTADITITIDPDEKIISCFQGFSLTSYKNIPMVYFPRVSPTVLNSWPGPRLAAYADHPSYIDIAAKLPRGKLFSSGSVLHPAVDLAVQMGAKEVLLFGADLAFPGDQRYTPGAGWSEDSSQGRNHWVLDGHGQKVSTIASFRGYLRDLESYIERNAQTLFVNSCRDGAQIKGTRFLEDLK